MFQIKFLQTHFSSQLIGINQYFHFSIFFPDLKIINFFFFLQMLDLSQIIEDGPHIFLIRDFSAIRAEMFSLQMLVSTEVMKAVPTGQCNNVIF